MSRRTMIVRPFRAARAKSTRYLTLSFVLFLVVSSIFFFVPGLFVGQVLMRPQHHSEYHPVPLAPRTPLQPFNFMRSSPNVEPSQARLALCISGNARTFHYHIVHGSILQKVLYPLANFTNVDVFFNIKMEDDPRPGVPSVVLSANLTRAAMARFNPVVVHEIGDGPIELEEDIGDDRMHNQIDANGAAWRRIFSKPANCSADPDTRAYMPHSLYRSQQCLTLIRQYEMAHGFQYTYVYRTRPDVVFLDNIPLPSTISPRVVMANIVDIGILGQIVKWWEKTEKKKAPDLGDHFLAALRQDADVAFNAVNVVHECDVFKAPIERNAESMLLFWLLKWGLTPVTPHVAWVLVREKRQPNCRIINRFNLGDRSLNDEMMAKCKRYEQKCDWERMEFCRP